MCINDSPDDDGGFELNETLIFVLSFTTQSSDEELLDLLLRWRSTYWKLSALILYCLMSTNLLDGAWTPCLWSIHYPAFCVAIYFDILHLLIELNRMKSICLLVMKTTML